MIEVFSYPTGTKLTGIIFLHQVGWTIGASLESTTGTIEELCEDSTLKNLVIMIHELNNVSDISEAMLQTQLSIPSGFPQQAVSRGAKIYRCTGTSKPDLAALRIILGGRSVIPEVQQEPINKGRKLEQTAVWPAEPSKDKEIEELRRELEEQKRKAQEEADGLRKCITEMQSKLEEDRHASGKASATCSFPPVPARSRVFFV